MTQTHSGKNNHKPQIFVFLCIASICKGTFFANISLSANLSGCSTPYRGAHGACHWAIPRATMNREMSNVMRSKRNELRGVRTNNSKYVRLLDSEKVNRSENGKRLATALFLEFMELRKEI